MKKIKFNYVFVVAAALVLAAGCKKSDSGIASLYIPTSSDVTATATLDELQQGRTLYINNCNSCHDLYSPDSYTPSQWNNIMGNMGMETSMMSDQIILVKKYVSRGK